MFVTANNTQKYFTEANEPDWCDLNSLIFGNWKEIMAKVE